MQQILDNGKIIFFGQPLADAENLFGHKAIDDPLRVARKGIDKLLKIKNVTLSFDSGRLKSMDFTVKYHFANPPVPYPEDWKNFPPMSGLKIYGEMPRDKFIDYLAAWEMRAQAMGSRKVKLNDMNANEFAVAFDSGLLIDMIYISMGPTRRAEGGGIWCDGWHALFSAEGLLKSLSAFRDEFNTVARPSKSA